MAQFFLGNVLGFWTPGLRAQFSSTSFSFLFNSFLRVREGISSSPTIMLMTPGFDNAIQVSNTSRVVVFEAQVKGIYFLIADVAVFGFKPRFNTLEIRFICSKSFAGREGGPQGVSNVKLGFRNLVELDAHETVTLFVPPTTLAQPSSKQPGAGFGGGSQFSMFLIKETT